MAAIRESNGKPFEIVLSNMNTPFVTHHLVKDTRRHGLKRGDVFYAIHRILINEKSNNMRPST